MAPWSLFDRLGLARTLMARYSELKDETLLKEAMVSMSFTDMARFYFGEL